MTKLPNIKAEKIGAKTLRLEIYDQIGPAWFGMIDGKTVSKAIKDAGDVDQINVHINSPGGSVWEGLAIYNILKGHSARVLTKVDGVAASSASVIAMAGDEIEIPKNALMMIHNPWTYSQGYASDLRKDADMLDTHKTAIVETYLTKTKKSRDEVAKLMDDETWWTGEEAVAAGFATRTTPELTLPSSASASNEVAAMYRRAPSNFLTLAALATGSPSIKEPAMSDTATSAVPAAQAPAAPAVAPAATSTTAPAAAAPAATPAAAAAPDAAADRQAVMAAERKRAADINAVCLKARKPELAAKFIEDGTTLVDVNAALLDALCRANPPADDGGSQMSGGTGADPANAKYKEEYAKNKANFVQSGVTEADYIKTRRIDDGLDPLMQPAA